VVGKSATTTTKKQKKLNALSRLRKIYSSHATTSIHPQSAAATEPHLQLENNAIKVVHSKPPQQLKKREQKQKV
jgi:hypothetical protein